MVSAKARKGYILRYYKEKGIVSLQNVKLNSYIISKEQKALINNILSSSVSEVNQTSTGSSEIRSLTNKINTIEKKLEGLQSSNTNTSLDSILNKIEQRIATIETKIA